MKKTFAVLNLLLLFSCKPDKEPVTPALSPRDQVIKDYKEIYLASEISTLEIAWTGNKASCNAGAGNATLQDKVEKQLHYFRKLARLPLAGQLSGDLNLKSQQAALMIDILGHTEKNPEPTTNCYSVAGAEACKNSVQIYSANRLSPEFMSSWINVLSNRRWLLFARGNKFGFGNSEKAAVLYAIHANTYKDALPGGTPEFIAWPPPGFVPKEFVATPHWSFSIPAKIFPFDKSKIDFSETEVVLTGQKGDTLNIVVEKHFDEGSFPGGDPTISWTADSLNLVDTKDITYKVNVKKVLLNGSPKDFTYEVILVDIPE